MLKRLKNYPYSGFPIEFTGRRIPLHAMLGGCGYNIETTQDYRWHGLQRGHLEFAIWQYTLSGKGKLECDGKSYDLNAGDAMMIHIPQENCYFLPEDSEKWEFLYLNLHGSEIMRIWRELGKRVGPVAHFYENSPVVELACEIYQRGIKDNIQSPYAASSLAYQFVMTMFEELIPGGRYVEKTPDFVDKVTTYAMNHLHEPLGVDDLANIAEFSRFHFSRIFKEWYGAGPSNFLHDMRMKRAVRLLQTERITIKEIADRCGFTDTSYFCKVFRKEFQISPEGFRNKK